EQYEAARDRLAAFVNARDRAEVVWTRGTTEAINLVAQCFAQSELAPGDAVLISELEHHSNIVPWQLACERSGATLRWIPLLDDGTLDLSNLDALLEGVKIVSVAACSNALGTMHPVRRIADAAHAAGAVLLVDAAQATVHQRMDVQAWDADFVAMSGHKAYGPTGIGALIGRLEWLDRLPPWHGGGEMIETVTLEGSTWNEVPYKFEAGTPNIAGAIGMAAALDWFADLDHSALLAHEQALLAAAVDGLSDIGNLRLIGTAADKAPIVSFVIDGVHPQDLATLIDQSGVAVRTGHHCAMPTMARFGIPGTVRASMACYNSLEDIRQLVSATEIAAEILR
ncbi:aminotransferase class V-fold PLP-dependent enzyme, partial [uncultured Abyssibacter sp.]|uniref:aminotransferase class V-fold PLP-dependent enzyme n=1 Tax=uncultured Abyssibacter sp. TaxID=2320202 RepID=UPI0032B1B547